MTARIIPEYTLQSMVKEIGYVPKSFILKNGNRFEFHTGRMSDGSKSAMIWQMWGEKKHHLLFIAYGKDDNEAEENLKQKIINA